MLNPWPPKPLLVIEIQLPSDTVREVTLKSRDYVDLGIQNIWVIDPDSRKAYYAESDRLEEVTDGLLEVPGTPIRVSLDELFAEMDRA